MNDVTEPRLHDLWALAAEQLEQAGVEQPRLDARLLIEYATGLDRATIMTRPSLTVTEPQAATITKLINRRAAREPVARIIGSRGFWSLDLELGPETLEPRPDTETLVDAVLGRVDDPAAQLTVLDLGTGTGAILLSLLSELPNATGLGTDISEAALKVAESNTKTASLSGRASFKRSDWAAELGNEGPFSIVVSNPPYIPAADIDQLEPEVREHDPRRALDGGEDGLDAYRAICAALPQIAAPGALIAFEMGIGQAEDVTSLLAKVGAEEIEILRDFGDVERVAVARMPQ